MVTILITTYSRGANLPAIIDSIVQQTYRDWRIVVCDNGDGSTEKILQGVIDKNPLCRIDYIHYDVELDGTGTMNKNFSTVKCYPTEYFVYLEDDTIYLDTNFLEKAVTALNDDSDIIFAVGGHRSNGQDFIFWDGDMVVSGVEVWERWPAVWMYFGACVIRYEILAGLGMQPGKEQYGDSLLLLKLALMGKVALLNTVCLQSDFSKTDRTWAEADSDPMSVLQEDDNYLRQAADFAIFRHLDRDRADNWYINVMAHKALYTANILPHNRANELIQWLRKRDSRIIDAMIWLLVNFNGNNES